MSCPVVGEGGTNNKAIVRAELTYPFSHLHHLHEGNIARYRLRLPEYRAWKRLLDEKCPNNAPCELFRITEAA